jgi:hypothetical protein
MFFKNEEKEEEIKMERESKDKMKVATFARGVLVRMMKKGKENEGVIIPQVKLVTVMRTQVASLELQWKIDGVCDRPGIICKRGKRSNHGCARMLQSIFQ